MRGRGPKYGSRALAAALAAAGAIGASEVASAAADPGPRFPRWPTEVDRAAAPLYSRVTEQPANERQRADAVLALDAFATPVIEVPLLFALDDPSLQVRREALRLCFERAVAGCIDGAATQYNDSAEPSLRIAALKVLALDPRPRSTSIVIAALRDSSEAIRAQSAELLGTAPLDTAMASKARAALVAKLPDVSAVVRNAAVQSLGLLGPGEGALAVARVLDDAEPTVQASAAEALGRMRDVRVAPALRRALQSPNEPLVTKAIVDALARLETPTGDAELLALVDDPPPGLNARQVADAIARRPAPGLPLVEGLVERLREPAVADACLHALLLLGDRARPGIEAILARGVDAPTTLELERLLAALDPPSVTPQADWPAATDADGWIAALAAPGRAHRLRAGLALGALAPPWLGATAGAMLADAVAPSPRRPWLVAVARADGKVALGASHTRVVARMAAWANDPALAVGDRCLAILGLATVAASADDAAVRALVGAHLRDPSAPLRACAVAASPKAGVSPAAFEAMLVDPDPRPRAAAALAVASLDGKGVPRSLSTRLAALAFRDPSGEVRQAASVARHRLAAGGAPRAVGLVALLPAAAGWADPALWTAYPAADDAEAVWLPTIGLGGDRWLVVPGGSEASAVGVDDQAPTTIMSPKDSLPTDISP